MRCHIIIHLQLAYNIMTISAVNNRGINIMLIGITPSYYLLHIYKHRKFICEEYKYLRERKKISISDQL